MTQFHLLISLFTKPYVNYYLSIHLSIIFLKSVHKILNNISSNVTTKDIGILGQLGTKLGYSRIKHTRDTRNRMYSENVFAYINRHILSYLWK